MRSSAAARRGITIFQEDVHMAERRVGTVSRGIRCPIIRQGDDLSKIVTESVLEAAKSEGFELRDRDVIAMTESIVARSQGNYCTVQDIASDVKAKLGGETVGVIFPILSRNRFAICLRGIAMGCKKIVLMLSYPSDEVGNCLVSLDKIDEAGVNPYSDVLSLEKYRERDHLRQPAEGDPRLYKERHQLRYPHPRQNQEDPSCGRCRESIRHGRDHERACERKRMQ